MKKFSFLTVTLLLSGSAMGQAMGESARVSMPDVASRSVISAKSDLTNHDKLPRLMSVQSDRQAASPVGAIRRMPTQTSFRLPAPEDAPAYVQEAPDGKFMQMVKGPCWGYAYNWMVGQIDAPSHGCIIDWVFAEDGKAYMRPVYSLLNNNCWLVGDVENGEVVFKFPQVANHFEYPGEFGNTVAYDEYCLVVGFKEDGDGSGQGWYYPLEDQTFASRSRKTEVWRP